MTPHLKTAEMARTTTSVTITIGVFICLVVSALPARSQIGKSDLYIGLLLDSSVESADSGNGLAQLKEEIHLDQSGKKPLEAIVAAAQQRFRPILLTTCTTTMGLVPLYLGGGLMWEPMAVAIMVGLLFATVITLLFVPVLYKLLFAIKE